jgi:hypothetical protein
LARRWGTWRASGRACSGACARPPARQAGEHTNGEAFGPAGGAAQQRSRLDCRVGASKVETKEVRQSSRPNPSNDHSSRPDGYDPRLRALSRRIKSLARVTFAAANWLDAPVPAGKYEAVTVFSVTKWIHLNWGDEGLVRLFHKLHRLACGDQGVAP